MKQSYEPVSVTSGYSAYEKKYLSSGCGAKLEFRDMTTTQLMEIARAALMMCPIIFEVNKNGYVCPITFNI